MASFFDNIGIPPYMFGVMMGIAACAGVAFGMTLLKWTHMKIERLEKLHEFNPTENPKPGVYYCQKEWWAGFGLIILASGPLDMGALALVPQSVFAPLSGLTLCLNAVISPWLLGENLANGDAAATALVVIGAGLTTMFGDHRAQIFTIDTLYDIFATTHVMLFECVVWVITAMMMITVKSHWFQTTYVANSKSRMGPGLYGLVAGSAGAQQFLFLKASIDLIKTGMEQGGSVFMSVDAWVFFAGAILCSLIQIRFLNEGLSLCDVVIFLPLYNTWLMIMGVLNGAIVYNDFSQENMGGGHKYVYFFLGCTLAVCGILALTMRVPGFTYDEVAEDGEDSSLLHPGEKPDEKAGRHCSKQKWNCLKDSLPDVSHLQVEDDEEAMITPKAAYGLEPKVPKSPPHKPDDTAASTRRQSRSAGNFRPNPKSN